MSPKNTLLTAGLTALGLFGYVATRAAGPGDPPAPPGPAATTAPSPSPTVLLKSNGDILRGTITEDATHYVVHQPAGDIRVPKGLVERTFPTVAGVYRYKLASVPDRDPDERLKLARWCLTQKMTAEAKVQLRAVLELSPSAREAKAMLGSIEAAEARLAATPRVDPGLSRTGAEVVEDRPGAPAEIDASVLREARRELGVKGVPVVFDLPPAVAVKRADQFARVVHPVLQAACAKCHNEQYPGSFQLVEVKNRRQLSGDVLRANLDATLRLVDPDNPSRSVLLSSALVPHGNGPSRRPIFRGSNDPRFQILSAWVTSLRPSGPRPPDGVTAARFGGETPAAGGSGFASERGQGSVGPAVTPTPMSNPVRPVDLGDASRVRQDVKGLPPARYVPGRGMVAESGPPSADEFPVPFAVGGARPKPAPGPGPAAPATPIPLPGQAPAEGGTPLPSLPEAPTSGGPAAAAATPPPSKPRAPVKLDPALLERALMNRNLGR